MECPTFLLLSELLLQTEYMKLTCYSLGSLVQSLIRGEQQRRVLKTDTHNYIGTSSTLSARAAHLIGVMSDTPLTYYSLGS